MKMNSAAKVVVAAMMAMSSVMAFQVTKTTPTTTNSRRSPATNTVVSTTTTRFASVADDVDVVDYAVPERYLSDHPKNNVPPHIAELVGRGLHEKSDHPLGIIQMKIKEYFETLGNEQGTNFDFFLGEDPIVTTKQCFDDLRIGPDHPGRSPSDTYYIDDETLLRTHTSAHQSQHLKAGHDCFLCAGDVYRRDEIDSSHYPAFHQLEGVKLFDPEVVGTKTGDDWLESDEIKDVTDDLKKTLEGLMDHLFGPVEKRWADDYFPFTEPSFEMEIMYEGEWLEVLGCGVVHQEVLEMAGRSDRRGWAFGLGLERLAMILFKIPDIRLFWTDDERFHTQFKEGQITTFKPYSKYPPVYKDIAFWLPEEFVENDFFEMARGVAGDLVERMELTDEFTNPKTGKTSKCFRITYRSMDRSLTDDEVN
eukprot:CAMPEP_0113522480 /NCGR_PEP_ID=MMETSP0014_2-20120614/45211_1 /TAXON_ID=2857 /ORGANISM="Nitzschia sp." /LENGTH=420 /DNA_ID=CAMNT_0000420539 /DNA_START=52 /DNA_END=1311 /DNA_ORIENTATION=- /assembly_acc=CAM_ASM_000159